MSDKTSGDWIHFHASGQRNPHFGEVQYRVLPRGEKEVKVILKPSEALPGFELSRAVLAIDGSKSMMQEFGAHLPTFLRKSSNRMQRIILELALFLATNASGEVGFAYWACGADGGDFEPRGFLKIDELEKYSFSGPSVWGGGTQITPIVGYFWDLFEVATGQSFALVVTDGAWTEEDQYNLLELTNTMCNEIAAGNRHPVKFVILALETETNKTDVETIQARFSALDDYEHPSGIDIWDHKWHNEIEDLNELFVEMVQEQRLGCPGRILADGVECFASDDLTFGFDFVLPPPAKGFVLQLMLPDEPLEIYQPLEDCKRPS